MFALQKRLTTFLCSGIKIVAECRYANASNHVFVDSRYMQKIISKKTGGKSSKTKKKWHQSFAADPLEIFNIKEPRNKQGESRTESTRARQLGHVLYDKIVQIINTGELSEELLSKQVSITSVKMLPSFQGVHVCWDNNRTDAAEVETLLHAHAGKLRSILISYHVLGRIPTITFVKEGLHTDLARLDQLFEIADYGPDYVPSQNSLQRSQLLSDWGRHLVPQPSDPLAANMNNTTDAGFYSPEATSVLKAEGSVAPDFVVNDNENSDSDSAQSSENNTQSVGSSLGLKFMSNVYNLPHNDLMKKVIAQKGKHPSELLNKAEATVDFDTKQLKSRKDKIRLQYVADSSRVKQRLLERDPEDFKPEDCQ
ncbi:unnamed protein product [Candidula unifasciata]|uniref:Ribosome-binding factor A, mitochondrial n=1 Tax=Candidula unifasciata TaxID=100452 RepID=A0A8S3YZT0_9EUPU|nr:unnamed protein product [Candidula unifasciata]